tara:strand:- start:6022 stop:6732 length:711 start_codon:yes stop_codon:yes gene_type:complete
MKILILTTDTPHHTYFVSKIVSKYKNTFIVCEKKKIKFPFKTIHSFEKKRDVFEIKSWFKNRNYMLRNMKRVSFIKDINLLNYSKLRKLNFSVIFVFGTGILRKNFLQKIKTLILNFHGGNPEVHRGLDSHLWAILNKKFNQLYVTLHKLIPEIDRGNILFKKKIILRKNMKIHELRKINTEICVKLAFKTINLLKNKKKLLFKKQKIKGKYFSAMKSSDKEKCQIIFNHYTKNIL